MTLAEMIYILCEDMATAACHDIALIYGNDKYSKVTPEYIFSFAENMLNNCKIEKSTHHLTFSKGGGSVDKHQELLQESLLDGWWLYYSDEFRPADSYSDGESWFAEMQYLEDRVSAIAAFDIATSMFSSSAVFDTQRGLIEKKYNGGNN